MKNWDRSTSTPPVEHLVDCYHIAEATKPKVAERRQVQRLEPRLEGELSGAGDELCGTPLDPHNPLLVRSVEWLPDRVGILQMGRNIV